MKGTKPPTFESENHCHYFNDKKENYKNNLFFKKPREIKHLSS